jgi:hypothetical protein
MLAANLGLGITRSGQGLGVRVWVRLDQPATCYPSSGGGSIFPDRRGSTNLLPATPHRERGAYFQTAKARPTCYLLPVIGRGGHISRPPRFDQPATCYPSSGGGGIFPDRRGSTNLLPATCHREGGATLEADEEARPKIGPR